MVRGHKVATRLATRADKDRQGDTEEGIEVMDGGHAKPLADPVGGGLEGVEGLISTANNASQVDFSPLRLPPLGGL